MTIVSFSEVYAWQTCTRQFYYHYGLGLTPIEDKDSISKGTQGHRLLQNFYRGIQRGLSKEEALEEMRELFREEKTHEFIEVWMMVEEYINTLKLEGEALLVEEAFVIPVAGEYDLSIGFTPDLVWNQKGKKIIIEDYKFVGRMWAKSKLSRYTQIDLYNTFLSKMGYDVSKGILRFFNLTTYKFPHQTYTPSQVRLDNLYKEFVRSALEIQEFKNLPLDEQNEIATRTINYTVCQWCSYVFPCNLELDGKDASRTLATQYKPNKYGYLG